MEYYLHIKLAHIFFALFSISFFVLRALWSVFESPRLKARWIRVLPHLNDTLLLVAAIYLVVVSHQYPFQQHWLTAKLAALVIYVVLGAMAIRRGHTPLQRGFFALLAIAVFIYIFAVAVTRSALPFG
ncbi:MAG: SirB2 family protein [Porticoccaceae bacterium]|nr:SirB2 family protein [Porticoccaceae bacterium]